MRRSFSGFLVAALLQSVVAAGTPPQTAELVGADRAGALVELFDDIELGPSAHVERCLEERRLFKGGEKIIVGCAVSIAPGDFAKLLFSYGTPLSHRSTENIQPNMPVPAVGPPFEVSDVYFLSPPEKWEINDTLIYTNAERTRLVAYLRKLILE